MRLNLAFIGPEAGIARGEAPDSGAGPTAGSGGQVARANGPVGAAA